MSKVHCLIMLLCLIHISSDAASVDISGVLDRIEVRHDVEYFEDPAAAADMPPATAKAAAFIPFERVNPNRGFSDSIHWLRFSVQNNSAETVTRWLQIGNPTLEHVTLFQSAGDGTWRQSDGVAPTPSAQRAMRSTKALFALTLAPGELRQLLVRVHSRGAIRLDMALWEPAAFWRMATRDLALTFVLIGITVLAALSCLRAYWRGRLRHQLYLTIMLLSLEIFHLYKLGILTMLLPEQLTFVVGLAAWAMVPVSVSSLALVHEILRLRTRLPRVHRFLAAVGATYCAGLVWAQLNSIEASTMLQVGGFCWSIACYGAVSVALHRQGYPGQVPFMAGRLLYYPLLMLPFLRDLGMELPPVLAEWGYQLAILKLLATMLQVKGSRDEQLREEDAARRQQAVTLLEQQVQQRTATLAGAANRADSANRAKSELFARTSHELRAPLHAILGYARLIGNPSSRVTLAEAASAINASARRQLGLIDELLEFARGDIGKLRLTPESIGWQDFVRTLAEEAQQMAESSGNVAHLVLRGEQPRRLLLDTHRLRQVTDNLLGNACRHTEHGTISILIRSTLDGGSARLSFEIIDTGSGIDDDKRAHLFEPFIEGAAGAGLGLAISAQIVGLLGGQLALSHTSSLGSCFAFELCCPLLPDDGAGPPAPSSAWQDMAAPVLPPQQLARINELVERGLLTDITQWAADLRRDCRDTRQAAFADDVAGAARRVDFGRLRHLLAQARHREAPANSVNS